MRRQLFVAIAVLVGAIGFAPPASAQLLGPSRPSVSEAFVRAHMEFLAGDALAGRGSGTRDEWLAATYVASQLRQWGLEPAGDNGTFVQTVQTPRGDLVKPPTLTAGPLTVIHGRDMLVRMFGSPRVSGPLVRFVAGTAPAPGSVLLVMGPAAPPAAVSAAAAAVLTAETPEVRNGWAATAANTRVTPTSRPWQVSLDAASWLAFAGVADGTTVTLEAEIAPGRTWNVVGKLPGASADRASQAILLSAHLDHLGMRGAGGDTIFNGADDDASGVTAVLELARVLASGRRPARTIYFALFGSEEAGGTGSRHFADHPPVPLTAIVANVQFEMIGRPDPKVPPGVLWLTGFGLSTLGPELARRGAKLVADPHPDQNFFLRSDNIQFAYRGVVAHTISSFGLHTDYHRASDEVSGIDFTHMTAAIRSLVQPIAWLASSSFQPAWNPGGRPQLRTPTP